MGPLSHCLASRARSPTGQGCGNVRPAQTGEWGRADIGGQGGQAFSVGLSLRRTGNKILVLIVRWFGAGSACVETGAVLVIFC